jgi:cysteate synthase
VEIDDNDGKKQIQQISAQVLSNRRPAYSVRGGVFDALTETRGDMPTADNFEALHASRLSEEIEGIDIDPAGAVGLAILRLFGRSRSTRAWIDDHRRLNACLDNKRKEFP